MTSNFSSGLFKVMLGLLLLAMGLVGTFVAWTGWKRAEETQAWKPVEAVITSSQVLTDRATPHSPSPRFTAEVHYRYLYNGESFISRRIKRVDGPSSHKERAEAVVAAHPVGATATCYVNPAQPDFAILEHEGLRSLQMIWFPVLFVVGGAGMVVSVLRQKKKRP